jgi:hypothetical protein
MTSAGPGRPARRTVRLPHGALVPVGVVLRVAGL